MLVNQKIYHLDTTSKDTVVTVEVIFEGDGNPTNEHTIAGVVIREDNGVVTSVGQADVE